MNPAPIAVLEECEACHAVADYACNLHKVLMADGQFFQDVMACEGCAAKCWHCNRWCLKGNLYEFGSKAVYKTDKEEPAFLCLACYIEACPAEQRGAPGEVQTFQWIPGYGFVVEHQSPKAHWFAPWTEILELPRASEPVSQEAHNLESGVQLPSPLPSSPVSGGTSTRQGAVGGSSSSATAPDNSPCGDQTELISASTGARHDRGASPLFPEDR